MGNSAVLVETDELKIILSLYYLANQYILSINVEYFSYHMLSQAYFFVLPISSGKGVRISPLIYEFNSNII